MAFDNLCKLLAEKHPETFTEWLFGSIPDDIEVLKTELSIEPIRADAVTFLKTANRILHFEFQTNWLCDPPMPLRQLDYWVRLHRLYRLPITQIVVVLLPPNANTIIENTFQLESTHHTFSVLKMWEQDPAFFLKNPILLPFAPLAQTNHPETLLQQIAEQVATIGPIQDQRQVSAYVQLMAGLKYNKEAIKQVFSEGIMRESVIFQEILQEGEARGEARGEAKGKAQGEAIGRAQTQLEIARGMLQEGIDIATIARITQLTPEQISQLQRS